VKKIDMTANEEMSIRSVHSDFTDQAVELLSKDYKKQRQRLSLLPDFHEFKPGIQEKVHSLFKAGAGIAVFSGDEMVGFLSGFKCDCLFGKSRGIYIPLYGHCAVEVNKPGIYQKLYAEAAGRWVREAFYSHVITLFCLDHQLVNTWFALGFGNRCVEAIKPVVEPEVSIENYTIIKAEEDDVYRLKDLYSEEGGYYHQSPLFMPQDAPNEIQELVDEFIEEDCEIWICLDEERAVGYMKITGTGESFLSEHPSVKNITGAYIDESYRGRGIGSALLKWIQRWLLEQEVKRLGVDFESFNLSGNRFWRKHFVPYTYSMTRRIDERVNQKACLDD